MLEMKVTITAATDLMAVLNNIAAALDGKTRTPFVTSLVQTISTLTMRAPSIWALAVTHSPQHLRHQ